MQAGRQANRDWQTSRDKDRQDRQEGAGVGWRGGGAKDKTKKHMYLKILKLNHTIKSLLC